MWNIGTFEPCTDCGSVTETVTTMDTSRPNSSDTSIAQERSQLAQEIVELAASRNGDAKRVHKEAIASPQRPRATEQASCANEFCNTRSFSILEEAGCVPKLCPRGINFFQSVVFTIKRQRPKLRCKVVDKPRRLQSTNTRLDILDSHLRYVVELSHLFIGQPP